jgi:hypothetical protein
VFELEPRVGGVVERVKPAPAVGSGRLAGIVAGTEAAGPV